MKYYYSGNRSNYQTKSLLDRPLPLLTIFSVSNIGSDGGKDVESEIEILKIENDIN